MIASLQRRSLLNGTALLLTAALMASTSTSASASSSASASTMRGPRPYQEDRYLCGTPLGLFSLHAAVGFLDYVSEAPQPARTDHD